ncbi:hypothetical protein ANCDUO_03820, partial [Ancylostoma duodenale]
MFHSGTTRNFFHAFLERASSQRGRTAPLRTPKNRAVGSRSPPSRLARCHCPHMMGMKMAKQEGPSPPSSLPDGDK